MPKVLRIINRFNLGGPTYNVAYLTKYMAPEYETLLVGGIKDETEESSDYIVKKLGIEPVIISSMKRSINPLNDYRAYKEIKKIIQTFKPDIVHTHAAKSGALGRLAAFSCKVPIVIHTFHGHTFHSYFGLFKTSIFKFIERSLAKRSSIIIAISEIQKEELTTIHNIVAPQKVKVVPLGFDLNRFREKSAEKRIVFRKQYNLDEDEIAIGIIGRLVPVKNHALFLTALNHVLKKSTKKVRAFIIGDGEEKEKIIDQVKEMGIDYFLGKENVQKKPLTFTSWIKEVDFALPGLDIVCLTSFNEGTPVSLIEAQAAGKPIVSTNVGGIENIVLKNGTALLADIDDVQTFHNHLLQLIEEPALREKLGSAGWDFAKEKFHYNRLVNDMKVLYDSLLKEI